MKVLVTGATGFVGGHLVERLLERGDTVTALVRSPGRATSLSTRGVRLVPGDLAATDAISTAVRGQDVVYHVAAKLGGRVEADFMAANREGTRNVARAAAGIVTPPRLVLVSSMAAGGPTRRGTPKTASGDDRPVSMYGRSKLAAEQVLAAMALPWTVLRPPVVYGPGDTSGFLPLFRAVKYGVAPTFGSGAMEVSLIHVADLADAIVAAGTSPDVLGNVFYVNHPEVVTAAALVRTIAQVTGRKALPLPIPRWVARSVFTLTGAWADLFGQASVLHPDKIHEFYQDAWTADPSAFIRATGWRPRWGLEEGLADTAAWYLAARRT